MLSTAADATQNQKPQPKNHTDQHQSQNHRIIPGGVVPMGQPTLFDAIKTGFGWGIGGPTIKKEPTEFERCLAEHRDDIAYCAQFAEKK